MVDKRIVETFHDIIAELHQFFFGQIQRFQQFFEHHFVDIFPQYLVLAGIPYDIHSGKPGNRCQNRMRTVQKSYFPLVVGLFARNKQYIQTRLVCRKFFGNRFGRLDYP